MEPLARCRDLFSAGMFPDALRELDATRFANRTIGRLYRIRILERLGLYDECRALTRWLLESSPLNPGQQATCHYVMGSLARERDQHSKQSDFVDIEEW